MRIHVTRGIYDLTIRVYETRPLPDPVYGPEACIECVRVTRRNAARRVVARFRRAYGLTPRNVRWEG